MSLSPVAAAKHMSRQSMPMLDWVSYESFKSGFPSNHESAAFTQLADSGLYTAGRHPAATGGMRPWYTHATLTIKL